MDKRKEKNLREVIMMLVIYAIVFFGGWFVIDCLRYKFE